MLATVLPVIKMCWPDTVLPVIKMPGLSRFFRSSKCKAYHGSSGHHNARPITVLPVIKMCWPTTVLPVIKMPGLIVFIVKVYISFLSS
jgi:hypothetical protein